GQEGVKNPVGMHGFRLDVETHIITAGVTSVQNLVKCIRGIGIDIDDLVLEPLASAEAVLTEEEKEKGVMLADIGGGTTDIAVFKDNTIYHTSVLPVAGYQITRDISVGLNIPFELAESMKKKYGNLLLVNDSKSSRNNNDDRTLTEDGHSVSYRDLSEILHVRLEELLRLIILELPRSDYAKLIPSGLVLCGGSANLPGIAELGQEVTRLPVRVGRPIGLSGVSDALNDPAYATSVGLLLWKKRNEGVQTWQPQSNVRRLLTKMFGFFR
ncbi:MAG: cell division protein FtsA, partial [Dehalococcoidales bacterium]|nr:cell division protein FtsA [Dehalococcoidales bacterium]